MNICYKYNSCILTHDFFFLFQACSENNLECSACQSIFSSQQDFTRHIRSHNRIIDNEDGTRIYECGLCGKPLSSNSSLDRHLLVHSGERPFRCYICGTLFTTNGNMHRHIRGHTKSAIDCTDSDGSDTSHGVARKRRFDDIDGPEPKLQKLVENQETDKSRSCSPNALEYKFRQMSPADTIEGKPCLKCGEKLSTVHDWILHLREHENVSPLIPHLKPSNNYFGFDQHKHINYLNSQVPQLPIATTEVPSSLTHEEQFLREYKDMKINGQYPCRLCKEIFSNLRKLKSHNIIHMNHPPYRCNLCTYYSNDKNALKEHMKGHKGDTPYECKLCGLAFTTKANCERHIKNIHTKQTREEIKECMSYNAQEDGGDLSQENKIDSICQICHIDYKSRAVLRDHMRSSHPEGMDKPFSCRVCRCSFANHADSIRHVALLHSDVIQSGNFVNLIEKRAPREISHDLSSIDNLLTISKIPLPFGAVVPKTMQPDRITLIPTMSQVTSAVMPSILSPAIAPIMSPTDHHLSSAFIPQTNPLSLSFASEDDAPLDLSINKSLKVKNELIGETNLDILNKTEVENSNSSENPNYTDNILRVPKHPYPHLMFGNSLPYNLQQLPFYLNSFNPLSTMINPISNYHNLLEKYQDNLRKNLQLSASSNLLQSKGLLPNTTSLALSMIAAQAANQEPLKYLSNEPERIMKEEPTDQSIPDVNNEIQDLAMKHPLLIKKPKQRRYRTERPWRCEICDKGFTLRSNMERHMKHQHSDASATSINKSTSYPLMHDESNDSLEHNNSSESPSDEESVILDVENSKVSQDDEDHNLVIDEVCERKTEESLDESDISNSNNNSFDATNQDFASVTTLLTKASTQNFTFFRNIQEEEEDHQSEDEDDDASGMTSPDNKKGSAYSSAPQKQKCPYCDRKFPWSSSLVRHIRTHTGQKPYTCEVCNYPFTTKSNCDRHLLRKHPDSAQALGGYKPYRCCRCPSAAFSSTDALRKHEMLKHGRPAPKIFSDVSTPKREIVPYVFRCFVCELALPSNRSDALCHIISEHPEISKQLKLSENDLENVSNHSPKQLTPPATGPSETVSNP